MNDVVLDATKQHAQSLDVEQSARRIATRRLDEDVVRLVLVEHVVDDVRRHGDLPAGLFLARMPPLDQPGDDRGIAEGAAHQLALVQPVLEVVAEHVLVEQLRQRQPAGADQPAEVAKTPNGERIVGGDEAERAGAGALQPAGQQHAESLVRQPPFERVAHHVVEGAARKGLDQHRVGGRQHRDIVLQPQPVAHLIGQHAPIVRIGQKLSHTLGEMGRERELATHVGRDLGVGGVGARDIGLGLEHPLISDDLGTKDEGIAAHQLVDEILFEFAQHAAVAADRTGGGTGLEAPALHQPDLDHRVLDDGADIEPVLLGDVGIGDAPLAVGGLLELGIALIGAQSIAAGGDEIDDALEGLPVEIAIRPGAADLVVVGERLESRRAGHAERVLGQHVEPADRGVFAVLEIGFDGLERRLAFEHLEAVGGDE